MTKEPLPKEDMLINFDEKSYNNSVSSLTYKANHLNKCIDLFKALDITPFEPEDLKELILNTEVFVEDRIIDQMDQAPVLIGGLKLSKEKLLDMSEKPEGYSVLIKEVEILKRNIERDARLEHKVYVLNSSSIDEYLSKFFTFNDAGKVLIKDSICQDIKKACSKFAKSDKAKKVMVFAEAFNTFIYNSNITDVIRKDRFKDFISSVVEIDSETNSPKINYDYVKRFDY